MRRTGMIVGLAAMGLAAMAAGQTGPPNMSLESGIYAEETAGTLDSAIAIFEHVIHTGLADRATQARAHLHVGLCHLKLGHTPQARTELEFVIGQFSDQKEVVDRAREALSKCTADEDKTQAQVLNDRGWTLWQERKLSEAEKTFEDAVAKDPANANAWNGLGWARSNQGKSTAAREAFERCVIIDPKHAAALNGLGWLAKGDGKTEEALRYWEKAIEAAPAATAALNGLATTCMETKQYEQAVKYYRMWLDAEPGNPEAASGLKNAQTLSGVKPVDPGKKPHPGVGKPGRLEDGTNSWFLAGNDPLHYEIGLDPETRWKGKPGCYLKSTGTDLKGFGTMMQEADAGPYRGKRLRVKAQVKADGVEQWAGLWLRIDGASKECLGFDNMQSRPIKGTNDWQPYEVVLDVPEASARIAYGILLTGKGNVWIGDFRLEPVGADVPTTVIK